MHLLFKMATFGWDPRLPRIPSSRGYSFGFARTRSPPSFRSALLDVLQPQDALNDERQEQDHPRRNRHNPRDLRVERTTCPPDRRTSAGAEHDARGMRYVLIRKRATRRRGNRKPYHPVPEEGPQHRDDKHAHERGLIARGGDDGRIDPIPVYQARKEEVGRLQPGHP